MRAKLQQEVSAGALTVSRGLVSAVIYVTMMPQDSSIALRALARTVSQGRDLSDVHPVLAKRALQDLYDRAHHRETDEAANVLWNTDFIWSSPTTDASPEERHVRELAAALDCTPQQAQHHLHTLWIRQNVPSEVANLQREIMAARALDRCGTGEVATIRAVRELSRAKSREVLREYIVLSEQLDDNALQVIAEDGWSRLRDSFRILLSKQAGYYDELVHDDPLRRTGDYLDNLSVDQAARLQSQTRSDDRPWTNAERQALERVLRRDPDKDAYYDHMQPRDAWNELCRLTGEDQPYRPYGVSWEDHGAQFATTKLRYEVSLLVPNEHIEGLYRAAHLGVCPAPSKDLAQRLGVGLRTSSREVQRKLQELTTVERQEIAEMMEVLRIDVDYALRLEGIEVDRNMHGHNWSPPVEPREPVPSLLEFSIRAAGRAGAWKYLVNLCDLNDLGPEITKAGRSTLAAALARKFPYLDEHLERLAHQLQLLPQIRAYRAAQLREQRQPAPKKQSVELEP